MGALDILKSGWEAVSGSGSGSGSSSGGGIFGSIMEAIGLKKPDVARDAQNAKESAEGERAGIFSEVIKSLTLRQCPQIAAALDIGKQLTGTKAPEVVPWQNEFETITAVLVLIPGNWKHYITDFFANSDIFRKIIEYWPGLDGVDIPLVGQYLPDAVGKGGNIRQRILNDKDPNAVIEALRVIHQDVFVTGKVSFDKLKDLLGGSSLGAAAAALGGGAALAVGAHALEGGSNAPAGAVPGTPGAAPGAPGEAVPGRVPGKKIQDLVKAHPEAILTTMQNSVLALTKELNVEDSAELVKEKWNDNNDYCTISFIFENGVYYLEVDNDVASTDLTLKNAQGQQILSTTDWNGLDAGDDAGKIIDAIHANPSPDIPSKDDKKDTGKPAGGKKADKPKSDNNEPPRASRGEAVPTAKQ